MESVFTRRAFLALGLAGVVSAGAASLAVRPAQAHEAKCPVCKLDVVQDTADLDNEVAIRFGRKRIEYRCVWCALSDSKTYNGDLSILAPSELKGKPVVLTRKEGKWSVAPETAVFSGQKVNHRHCQVGYRALTNRAAFDAWVKKHAEVMGDARPLTLAEMLELAK
jgi:hypothetical protein